MNAQDFRQPDWPRHFVKTLRRYAYGTAGRIRRLDLRILALGWEVTGVDISRWQGGISNPEKFASMVDFAIIRAGYGDNYIDPRLDEYRQVCHDQNIPFGLYWYATPSGGWAYHARSFFDAWRVDPGALPPDFDLEETGGLSKASLESWWKKMYSAFNSLSGLSISRELTYTSPGFLNRVINLTDWLRQSSLHVAHWTIAPQPEIPNEWASVGRTWAFWQWSAIGRGADYGVASRYIDLNRYNGSREQFDAEFGLSPPQMEPGEDELRYRVIAPDYLNVRAGPGTNYADVGDLPAGTMFAIRDIKAGNPSCSTWLQIKDGQYAGRWVCLVLNGDYYAELLA